MAQKSLLVFGDKYNTAHMVRNLGTDNFPDQSFSEQVVILTVAYVLA